ncbi:hypothetical protein H9636_16170 [Ureibacillus sp. Re31]|uniref:Metallothionein n=1 Tax=Ureibacillus galli TaxID=2762222 RepID=A0ABR8XG35_9BACL|nr:hypothetical protein [Ureibacillus galli]MBD8028185.1 hypothetical protein [Ureibacillus galli]
MYEVENPMLSPKVTDDPIAKVIGKCHYRYCDEEICKHEGIEFEGYIYCCATCLGSELLEEGHAVDLSK